MFNRRRLSTITAAAACLLIVSAASADPINTHTGVATPSHVKPSTSASYSVSLTNDTLSPEGADRAKIGIPPGFLVDAPSVQATTSVAAGCQSSTWVADGDLIADAKINLKRPGTSSSDELCAGATLTVLFTATSGAVEGMSVWTSELLRGVAPFALLGAQPTVQVDGSPPQVGIGSQPANPSNDVSPTFSITTSEPATLECRLDQAAFAPCASPKSYTGLSVGPHSFVVRATDPAGNVGQASYSWTIDTDAPGTEITVKPTDPTNDSSPSFSFASSEGSSTFACKLDDAAVEACVSPKTYSAVATGSHTFSVRATDAAGNTGAAETYTWTIDTTAPTTAITQKPGNPSNDTSPSFAFSASEAGSQFACRLDGGSFAPCVSIKTYTGLGDGSHTFSVRATDPAGNLGVETSHTWVVDTIAPTATISGKPSDPSNVTSPSFSFTASQLGSTFLCKLDGAVFAACAPPTSYPGLVDGLHTFVVKALDPAGNPSAEQSYTWTIDSVSPTATITGKPSDPSNNTSPSFSFTASESGSTFRCRLDGGAFTACASPKQHLNVPAGTHTFTVQAMDRAGNTSPQTHYSWTLDTAAPTAEITQKPAGLSNNNSASFSFTASQGGSTFVCRLDGAAFAACVSPKNYLGVADGAHTFAVRATDPAGNTSAETSYTWTVDTTAPATLLVGKPSDPSNDSSPSFSFSAGEAGSNFACKLDAGAFASCTSPTDLGPLAQGPHTFSVRATDAVGNTGAQVSHTWTIDTTAPTATITQKPADLSNNRAPSFAFTASETGVISCRLDGGAFAPCASPKNFSGLGDGSHTFAVRATDEAGNMGTASSHTWTIDATAPTVTLSQKPSDPSNDSSPNFGFGANETAAFQCKLDAAASAACNATASYVNVGQGLHTFLVTATDPAGNTGQASYGWRIDTTAPTVTITQKPANPSNTRSPTFAFSSNEAGVVYACRLELGGFEPCSTQKTYAGLTDGQHAFAVRATDPAGNTGVAATYTWTIDTLGPATAITGKPGNPSNNPSPTFSFMSSEDASFVCLLDGSATPCTSPAGYSGMPDGPHTFSVRATDAAGNTGAETAYSWTIETRAPTAALTSGPPGLSNTSAASFAFTADEPSSFDCMVDERGFEPCNTPATYHGLADGAHAFAVRARDAVGNFSAPVARSWTIDTTAPETTVVSAPKSGSATSATFAFSASEGGTFECRLDGAAFALCSSPKSYSGLIKATHQFEVRAVDAAGNADATPAVHAWKIETAVIKAAKSALMAPRAGARVTRPPLLVWRRATRARYYNVQVYRGRRKVLTAWPTKTRFQLQTQWKNLGRKEQLLPGSYRWYVWPGYGAPTARRYGQVLGQSTFVVARRSGR